ncbi:MAG TPA: hypothetical protein VN723_15315 [Rhizomicrobium sp.]|nr:hypothetical protein [Rhizomicrobium sp.]
MRIIAGLFGLAVAVAIALSSLPVSAETMDLNCNNGIVSVPLHLDTAAGAITMEGTLFRVGFGSSKISFSMSDPAGDKIDYVLDRAANTLTETDRDRMPDGSFKTISLQYSCAKSAD